MQRPSEPLNKGQRLGQMLSSCGSGGEGTDMVIKGPAAKPEELGLVAGPALLRIRALDLNAVHAQAPVPPCIYVGGLLHLSPRKAQHPVLREVSVHLAS